MKILLLITPSEDIVEKFRLSLKDEYIVLTAHSLEQGSDLIRPDQINLIAIDITISESDKIKSWFARHRNIQDIMWLGIVSSDISEEEVGKYSSIFHEIICTPISRNRLKIAIKNIQERLDTLSENKHLKLLSIAYTEKERDTESVIRLSPGPLEKAVPLFRTFTASLDLDKLIDLFLDAVTDVVGVSRISFLLYNKEDDVYRVKASRGIHPDISSRIYLTPDSGMILWLSTKGRILRRDKVEGDVVSKGILIRAFREMEVLQSVVGIPIMYEGKLLCILNLDRKITSEPYSSMELEKLFILSNYFGKAIQDIYKYNIICNQKEYTQKILERMGTGVITVNEKEEIIIFNPKAEEILKEKAADIKGRPVEVLPEPITRLIRETVRDKKAYKKHEVISEEDNLYVEVDTYGLYDISGLLIGGVILLEDISAREELSREKKKGENLQLLNELVGRMAHELRNPLVAVRTFTQLMKDRYSDPEFQDFFFSTVTGEVEKLNSLIEKLIAFAHPIEYKFDIVDLGEVLDNSLESILRAVKTSNIQLIKNYTPGIFKIRADNKQIYKAFSYILQNSFNAMQSGGTLTLNVESALKDATIKISVKDTGRGIPPEDLKKVFDPFYTTPEKGIGLGLPLSQKIIEEHGGKVSVSSVFNHGTTLTILLPIAAQTEEEV